MEVLARSMTCRITSPSEPDQNPVGQAPLFWVSEKKACRDFHRHGAHPTPPKIPCPAARGSPDTSIHLFFFSRIHRMAMNAPSMTSTMRMRRGGFSRWYSGPIMNPSKSRPNENPMRIAVRTTSGVRYFRRTENIVRR